MTSRNINVEISVYERLKKIKGAGESFSEVLERLLSTGAASLEASFGILKDEPLDYREIKKSRRDRDVPL